MDKRDELRLGFETAYIDGSVASNSFYSPQFVSNNYKDGKKVLSSIEDELLRCDKFQISVAFITLGGITPLLQTLKVLEKKNESTYGDIQIKIDGDNNLQELSLNSILKLMYCIEKDWTKKQREVVNYVLFEKKNQTETAHYFNVTQSNIQQILSKTHFYAYKDAFDSVNKILSEVKYDNKL